MNDFCFKDPFLQILSSGALWKFQFGLCNEFYYGECVIYLAMISGEHVGISLLSNESVQSRKDSTVYHYL